MFVKDCDATPWLWKADIDAAYRRIPIRPDQRWAAWIAFVVGGVYFASGHVTMPFGATASVHAWNRVGALLCHIARRVLMAPVLRYVDDFFCIDFPECAKHTMDCFARIVRALLGVSAVAERKLDFGCPLVVLGLVVDVKSDRVRLWPTKDKTEKWISRIQGALDTKCLKPGMASKLAGALNWTSQHIFRRLGRAMLRPLYYQQCRPSGRVGLKVDFCLRWWLEVLELELCQEQFFEDSNTGVVELFCDARGFPARLAAVLFCDGEILYTDWEPPTELLQLFVYRDDNQIMGLELLSIALGLSTFRDQISGRNIRVWSDNVGCEKACKKGASRKFDHNCIVHCLWLVAAQYGIGLHIERVATDDNIADLPSRESYTVLANMGATWMEPCLEEVFWQPESWESLSLRHIVL